MKMLKATFRNEYLTDKKVNGVVIMKDGKPVKVTQYWYLVHGSDEDTQAYIESRETDGYECPMDEQTGKPMFSFNRQRAEIYISQSPKDGRFYYEKDDIDEYSSLCNDDTISDFEREKLAEYSVSMRVADINKRKQMRLARFAKANDSEPKTQDPQSTPQGNAQEDLNDLLGK